MLNLYFGNFKDALLSGNSYFDLNIDESCIETDFGRRIIKEISGADVLDKNSVIHPIYGSIPTRDLAGGIKAFLEKTEFQGMQCLYAISSRSIHL